MRKEEIKRNIRRVQKVLLSSDIARDIRAFMPILTMKKNKRTGGRGSMPVNRLKCKVIGL